MNKTKAMIRQDNRIRMIAPLINQAQPSKDVFFKIAADNNVSIRTIKRWYQRYKEKGVSGLIPIYQGSAKNCRLYIGFEQILEEAMVMRRHDPNISVKNIIYAVESKYPSIEGLIKRSTLQRHLHKHHCGKNELLTGTKLNGRKVYGRFRKEHRMEQIQCDVKEFPRGCCTDSNGNPCNPFIQLCIDNYSRKILSYKIDIEQKTSIVIDSLKQMIAVYGLPKSLLFDNGAIYRSDLIKRACRLLCIDLKFCKPYAASTKGVVERVNLDLNAIENQLRGGFSINFDAFTQICQQWIIEYNSTPHSALDNHSPDEVFNSDVGVKAARIEEDLLNYVFLKIDKRRINKDGTISFEGNTYKVNTDYAQPGTYVEVISNGQGGLEQVLDDYTSIPIQLHEISANVAKSDFEVTPNTISNDRLDAAYLISLYRESLKAKGAYINEEHFLQQTAMLFSKKSIDELAIEDSKPATNNSQEQRGCQALSPYSEMTLKLKELANENR